MKKLWMMGEGLPGPDGALEEQQILFSIVLIGIRAKIFLITHLFIQKKKMEKQPLSLTKNSIKKYQK